MTMLRMIDKNGVPVAERTALQNDFRLDIDRMMIVGRPGLKILTSESGEGPFTVTLGSIVWKIPGLDTVSASTVVHLVLLEASIAGEGT